LKILGDALSYTCVLAEEAKEEINKLLNSNTFYIDLNNKMNFSSSTPIVELVLSSITGD
jgi:hypothetical protein